MPPATSHKKAETALRDQGLGYPETQEDFPWGHRALKVRGKAFAWLSHEDGVFSVTVKLPYSTGTARELPFAEPSGYGLGPYGWITARFGPRDAVPLDLLRGWLLESYCAVAPPKLADRVLPSDDPPPPKRRAAKKAARPRR